MTVLYWKDYTDKGNYQKDKDESLKRRDEELTRRESIVVDKEICFRELTKLRTILASALDILKMYDVSTSPTQSASSQETFVPINKPNLDNSSVGSSNISSPTQSPSIITSNKI